jgi:hypothetical protein
MGGSHGMFDPGNVNVAAPYFIAGKSNTITALAATNPVARLVQLGMLDPRTPGAIVPTPIRISKIRLKYLPITTLTTGIAFEVHKGTGTQAVDGLPHLAKRRKTTGYPTIGVTETSLNVSDTALLTGGSFTPLDADTNAPFEMMMLGGPGFAGYESIWTPSDLCPLTLEAGEALQVQITNALTGTGVFYVCFDFLR